jgi:hypothetical protein
MQDNRGDTGLLYDCLCNYFYSYFKGFPKYSENLPRHCQMLKRKISTDLIIYDLKANCHCLKLKLSLKRYIRLNKTCLKKNR